MKYLARLTFSYKQLEDTMVHCSQPDTGYHLSLLGHIELQAMFLTNS
jgi:hypothetical protein